MYIPPSENPKATSLGNDPLLSDGRLHAFTPQGDATNEAERQYDALRALIIEVAPHWKGLVKHEITKRQFSNNPMNNTNIKIGIALGFVLGIFLIGLCAFLWVYRYSVRCTSKRKTRSRHGSSSSKSSESSQSSSGGDEAPEEAEASGAADEGEADAEAGDGDGETEAKKEGE